MSAHYCRVLTLVNCLVVVTGLIRNAMFVGILPHPSMVPSVTGARLSAVNHVLDGKISRWPHSFPLDVDTIYTRQRRKFPTNAIFVLEKLSSSDLVSLRFPSVIVTRFNVHTILENGKSDFPPKQCYVQMDALQIQIQVIT